MKTLEEAIDIFRSPSGKKKPEWNRYKSSLHEMARSQGVMSLSMAIFAQAEGHPSILDIAVAISSGVLVGMEMEKQEDLDLKTATASEDKATPEAT